MRSATRLLAAACALVVAACTGGTNPNATPGIGGHILSAHEGRVDGRGVWQPIASLVNAQDPTRIFRNIALRGLADPGLRFGTARLALSGDGLVRRGAAAWYDPGFVDGRTGPGTLSGVDVWEMRTGRLIGHVDGGRVLDDYRRRIGDPRFQLNGLEVQLCFRGLRQVVVELAYDPGAAGGASPRVWMLYGARPWETPPEPPRLSVGPEDGDPPPVPAFDMALEGIEIDARQAGGDPDGTGIHPAGFECSFSPGRYGTRLQVVGRRLVLDGAPLAGSPVALSAVGAGWTAPP